jgi:hypothetical protein
LFRGNLLNLAAPPRPVPLSVRVVILFGGFMNQFGWLFVGFGLIFVWVFTLRADVTSWFYFRGQTRREDRNRHPHRTQRLHTRRLRPP